MGRTTREASTWARGSAREAACIPMEAFISALGKRIDPTAKVLPPIVTLSQAFGLTSTSNPIIATSSILHLDHLLLTIVMNSTGTLTLTSFSS